MGIEQRHRQTSYGMWLARLSSLLLLLSACHAEPSPPPVAAVSPSLPVPPRPVVKPPVRESIAPTWSFSQMPDVCTARAVQSGRGLVVSVRRDTGINISIKNITKNRITGKGNIQLSFSGVAGEWSLRAVENGQNDVAMHLPLDDVSVGYLLILLGGGTLETGDKRLTLPILQLASSDAEGQAWFDCVRSKQF